MVKNIILIIAITMIAFSGVALASDNADVTVSANVVGTCKFNSGGSVDFGDLDPSVGGPVTGSVVQPEFWCTRNASYTISDDNGKNGTYNMKHATLADLIPYLFTYTTTGTGDGPSNPLTMDISSSVAEADYLNASAGSYSDTVTLTINP